MSEGWNIRPCLKSAFSGIAILAVFAPGDVPLAELLPGPGPRAHAAQTVRPAKALLQESSNAAAEPAASRIPPVLLSAGHRKLCRIFVGDHLPPIELPRLGGDVTELASLQGKRATVVLFWHPDRWMARGALGDLSVLARQWAGKRVALVGIACGQPAGAVQAQLTATGALFPQLLDTDGHAFSLVSQDAGPTPLPWIYVLDKKGKIVWFDIEYSEATRRELRQTIAVLTAGP